jgi:hypothetical protein
MTRQQIEPRPERITKDGRVILSHNHISLLKGLHDQPDGRVASRIDWIIAATPYQQRFSSEDPRWPLTRAIASINRKWIREVRKGRCIETTLTERGREIIERKVPSRIVGIGPFRGFPRVRRDKPDRHASQKQQERERIRVPERTAAAVPSDARPQVAATESQPVAAASGARVVPKAIAPAYPAVTDKPAHRPQLPQSIRRAIDFAGAFGLPLLEPNPDVRTRGTIMAVSTGLDRFFRIACREELDMRAARRWHLMWTRSAIDVGMVPAGYLEAFQDFDEMDILFHLREVREDVDSELDRYVLAYRGKLFLSRELREQWLDERIDLRTTDMNPECLTGFVRARSIQYQIAMQSIGRGGITWRDPETEKLIGRAVKQTAPAWEMEELEVTTPAALSCLQQYWDERGVGLDIETRYVPQEL